MEKWQEKRILILGTTYPAYSTKYTEIACTGGILEETMGMVRLHPVPHRYLEPGSRFKSFQWIRAQVTQHTSDPRPESLRIKPGSIQTEEVIPSTKPEERLRYIENSPHLCRSVEDLKDRQKSDKTSLGIVKPQEILGCFLEARSETARQEWEQKEREVLRQTNLFGEELKPIDFPDTKFSVQWRCDDPRCETHSMGLLQWGLHELNRKYRNHPEREKKVLAAMEKQLDQTRYDVYFFMGNFRGVMFNFGLMDSYSVPHIRQTSLF